MRNLRLPLAVFALALGACAPKGDMELRAREHREYPDPTQGTDNIESQTYKAQTLAAPPAPTQPSDANAKPLKTSVKRPTKPLLLENKPVSN